MSKSRFGILIAFFVLFISGMLTAQDTTNIDTDQNTDFNNDTYQQQDPTMQQQDGVSEALVEDLKLKLNLREDQVSQISDVVERYRRESATMQTSPQTSDEAIRVTPNTELQNRYNSEIETILDENQKIQFREYSATWWNSVNSREPGEETEINRDYKNEGTQGESEIHREGTQDKDTDMQKNDTETDTDNGTDTETDTDTDTGTESGSDIR